MISLSYEYDCKCYNQKIYFSKLNEKYHSFEDRYCIQHHSCFKRVSYFTLVDVVRRLKKQFTSHEVRIRDFERRLNHE